MSSTTASGCIFLASATALLPLWAMPVSQPS